MKNEHVKIWQQSLADDGFYTGVIDGDFGPGTRRASFEAINVPDQKPIPSARGLATIVMANQNATRNKPITQNMHDKLISAVTAIFGDARIVVYSGGQDRRGKGKRRTGSVRHDDYGSGGRAADCYIYVDGKKATGVKLAKLGQYWLAKRYGGCGLEMATGGIHLDEWTTPPRGGGMFWTYKYSDRKSWGKKVRAMLVRGSKGKAR